MAIGDPLQGLRNTPLSAKVGTNLANKRQSLGQCSLRLDSGHGVSFVFSSNHMDITKAVKSFLSSIYILLHLNLVLFLIFIAGGDLNQTNIHGTTPLMDLVMYADGDLAMDILYSIWRKKPDVSLLLLF
jgi:hypothetical protein